MEARHSASNKLFRMQAFSAHVPNERQETLLLRLFKAIRLSRYIKNDVALLIADFKIAHEPCPRLSFRVICADN